MTDTNSTASTEATNQAPNAAVAPAPETATVRPPSAGSGYIVKKGDTLASIAEAQGVTFSQLQRENAIKSQAGIWAGMKLRTR